MIEKLQQLIDSLDESESESIINLLESLILSWEDDKINLYTEISDFHIYTILKVLRLFQDEQTEAAEITIVP
jgi:hypothetical protein